MATVVVNATPANYGQTTPPVSDFKIGLFEVGDLNSCLFSWCCTPCAGAMARSNLDGSEFCFNLHCMFLPATRWVVRSAYGIGDKEDCTQDCCLSCLVPCCVVNQMYQTTSALGNPTPDGGRDFNVNRGIDAQSPMGCANCLYACFCMQCAIATTAQRTIGMPWCLAFCCVGPFSTRNLVRYHYRMSLLSSKCEYAEECILPTFVGSLGLFLAILCLPFFCCSFPIIVGGLTSGCIGVVTQLQAVADLHAAPGTNARYMVSANVSGVVAAQPVPLPAK